MSYDKIDIVEEVRNSSSRHRFRQLSREVCKHIYDIPDGNNVLFAYRTLATKQMTLGGISFQLADRNIQEPGINFDTEFYHSVNFLFVKIDYQCQGIGRKLMCKAIDIMFNETQRPVRVQSAESAVGFFQKMGFILCGEPFVSMCSVKLFNRMVNMELPYK